MTNSEFYKQLDDIILETNLFIHDNKDFFTKETVSNINKAHTLLKQAKSVIFWLDLLEQKDATQDMFNDMFKVLFRK
jgi:hypothetical protein